MVNVTAPSIRAAIESATFDFAGHDAAAIRSIVNDAFSEPLPLATMIRITFITGGGKLSRSKYDDKAMQAVSATLKQLDYVEDRGASCTLDCAGCFKTQHDTGKNAYTVVVFPRVEGSADSGQSGRNPSEEEEEPLIPTNSPGYKMAVCSQRTFLNLLSTYCPTYLEKRECLGCLEGLLELEQAIENKLTNGHPLDSAEQSFYDESSDLKEKIAYAQKEASRHVEEGRLTSDEKSVLVTMNDKKIETLMNEKSSAAVAEKLKKALARKRQLQSLGAADAGSSGAAYPPPLRHEAQLTTLRKKLLPLQELEDSSKGRLLTLSETRSLTEKGEMEREVERLEIASCGWFEEDGVYQERLLRSRERFEAKYSRSKRGGGNGKHRIRTADNGGGLGNATAAVSKWILPGEKPKSTWGVGKKKFKVKGGAVFSAMMMDSSSDEEEEDSDDGSVEENREERSFAPASGGVASKKGAATSSTKKSNNSAGNSDQTKEVMTESKDDNNKQLSNVKKNKKKKKKKKKPKLTEQEEIQGEVRTDETTVSDNAPSASETPSTVSDSLALFWRYFLLPCIMLIISLLSWVVTSLLGLGGKRSKKVAKKKRG